MKFYNGSIKEIVYHNLSWFVMLPFIIISFFSVKSARFLDPVIFISALAIIWLLTFKPKYSLVILPFLSYVLPASFTLSGISPGMILTIIVLISIGLHITTFKIKFKLSLIWIFIIFILIIENLNGLLFTNLLQGFTPFFIFSILINNEKDGRLILKCWTIAFASFSVIHMINALASVQNASIIRALANIRMAELSGQNPNDIGWTALLLFPLALVFAKISQKRIEKIFWWLIFFIITSLITFTFSRAGMVGMFSTFLLIAIFFRNRGIEYGNFNLSFVLVFGLLYYVWTEAVTSGVMDSGRQLTFSGLSPEFFKRWDLIKTGFMLAYNDQAYDGDGGFHSVYIKLFFEYGVTFLFLILFMFFYLIKVSYTISNTNNNEHIKLISLSIFIVFIVASYQALFGITLFSAKYLQIFFLIVGYLQILNKEQFSMASYDKK